MYKVHQHSEGSRRNIQVSGWSPHPLSVGLSRVVKGHEISHEQGTLRSIWVVVKV